MACAAFRFTRQPFATIIASFRSLACLPTRLLALMASSHIFHAGRPSSRFVQVRICIRSMWREWASEKGARPSRSFRSASRRLTRVQGQMHHIVSPTHRCFGATPKTAGETPALPKSIVVYTLRTTATEDGPAPVAQIGVVNQMRTVCRTLTALSLAFLALRDEAHGTFESVNLVRDGGFGHLTARIDRPNFNHERDGSWKPYFRFTRSYPLSRNPC